jgi:hypothetical protein
LTGWDVSSACSPAVPARLTDSTDVTYVTPYFWIEEQIKKAFPDSYLYPIKE